MPIHEYLSEGLQGLFQLEGKTAIVTGGAGTIGSALARGLSNFGANVVLCGRTQESLDTAAHEIVAETKGRVLALAGDSTRSEDCENIASKTLAEYGKIDILINASGMIKRFPSEDFPMDAFDQVLRSNVRGVFLMSKVVGNQMIAQNSGKIINISSVRAHSGHTLGYAAYASSKGAVNALTRQLAIEWAKYDINVNCIASSVVVKPSTKEIFENAEACQIFTQRIPFQRAAIAEELIGTAVYLASSASNFVTGQVIYVDGGYVAG